MGRLRNFVFFAVVLSGTAALTSANAACDTPAAAAVTGSIDASAFPREIRVTADGRTLLVTNFASKTVEFVDLERALK